MAEQLSAGNPIWYHGVLSKSKADQKLTDTGGEQGQFLVRDRPGHPGEYVLGIMFKGRPTHHLVRRDPASGTLVINNKDYGPFNTISEVVNAFSSPNLPDGWPVQLTDIVSFESRNQDAAAPEQVDITMVGAGGGNNANYDDRHGTMGTTEQEQRAREAAQAARQAEQLEKMKRAQAEAAARQAEETERQLAELQQAKEEAEIRRQQEQAIARHQQEQEYQHQQQLAALAPSSQEPDAYEPSTPYMSQQSSAGHTIALPGMPIDAVTDTTPNASAYKPSSAAGSPYQQVTSTHTSPNAYASSQAGYGSVTQVAAPFQSAGYGPASGHEQPQESYIRRIHDSRLDATRSEFDHGDFFRIVVLRPGSTSFGIGIGQQLEITGWVKAVNFVDPRGPADSFFQVDDEIVSINGKPTAELELQQVKEILRNLGNMLDVVVFRRRPKLEGHKPSSYSHKKKLDDRCSNTVWCSCAECREREEEKKKARAKMMAKVRGNPKRKKKDEVVNLSQGYGKTNDAYIV